MKKAVNITLGGIIFNIEEDAYNKLNDYLESIKKRYKTKKEQTEIMDDIEAGIAEKFSRGAGSKKQAITIKDVQQVVKVMGSAEEIADEKEDNDKDNEINFQPARRLYRDPDDVVIAGICSGLAAYFGIDPVFVRLIFFLLIFANGVGILAYFILWIVVSKADSSAQKLEMRGRPVNIKKLEEAVKDKSKIIKREGINAWKNLSKNKPLIYKIMNLPILIFQQLINFMRRLFRIIWPAMGIILGLIFALSMIVTILALTLVTGIMLFNINSPYIISDVNLAEIASNVAYYFVILSTYVIALIPIIFILLLGLALIKRKNVFTLMLSGILVSIWILAIATVSISGLKLAPTIHQAVREVQNIEVVTQNFNYDNFTKLYLGGNFKASIIKGEEFSIIAKGEEKDIQRMNFNIEDGQLQIMQERIKRPGICVFCFDKPVEVEIIMPELASYVGIHSANAEISDFSEDIYISLGESARLKFNSYIEQNITGSLAGVSSKLEIINSPLTLDMKLDGFARLEAEGSDCESVIINQDTLSRTTLGGQSENLQAELEGSSRLYAFKLSAQNATIKATSHSQAQIKAIDSLQVIASEHGRVLYRGMPKDLNKKVYQAGIIKEDDNFDIDDFNKNSRVFIDDALEVPVRF